MACESVENLYFRHSPVSAYYNACRLTLERAFRGGGQVVLDSLFTNFFL